MLYQDTTANHNTARTMCTILVTHFNQAEKLVNDWNANATSGHECFFSVVLPTSRTVIQLSHDFSRVLCMRMACFQYE